MLTFRTLKVPFAPEQPIELQHGSRLLEVACSMEPQKIAGPLARLAPTDKSWGTPWLSISLVESTSAGPVDPPRRRHVLHTVRNGDEIPATWRHLGCVELYGERVGIFTSEANRDALVIGEPVR